MPQIDPLVLELLRKATTPLVPQIGAAGQSVADASMPGLNDSPNMARVKGFAGGAVKGLSDLAGGMTSPVGILGLLAGGAGGAMGRGASMAAGEAASLAPEAAQTAVPAVARVASELPAEFLPASGEGLDAYNALRQGPKASNMADSIYKRIMESGAGNMGKMGSQTGAITPEAAIGTTLGVGGGGLALKKLYDLLQNGDLNPFKRVSDTLDNATNNIAHPR